METAEKTVQAPQPRQRRVGTFTLGVVLVAAGVGMLASMFYPKFQPEWLLKASPCILILLGVETLLSARGGGRVKYDWLGMFLCFILTGAALCMYAAAWWVLDGPGFPVYNGSWIGAEDSLTIRYDYFNDRRYHTMDLTAGDRLNITCDNQEGWLGVELYTGEDWELVYAGDLGDHSSFQVDIPVTGEYCLELSGHRAAGHAAFTRLSGPGLPAGTELAPEDGA